MLPWRSCVCRRWHSHSGPSHCHVMQSFEVLTKMALAPQLNEPDSPTYDATYHPPLRHKTQSLQQLRARSDHLVDSLRLSTARQTIQISPGPSSPTRSVKAHFVDDSHRGYFGTTIPDDSESERFVGETPDSEPDTESLPAISDKLHSGDFGGNTKSGFHLDSSSNSDDESKSGISARSLGSKNDSALSSSQAVPHEYLCEGAGNGLLEQDDPTLRAMPTFNGPPARTGDMSELQAAPDPNVFDFGKVHPLDDDFPLAHYPQSSVEKTPINPRFSAMAAGGLDNDQILAIHTATTKAILDAQRQTADMSRAQLSYNSVGLGIIGADRPVSILKNGSNIRNTGQFRLSVQGRASKRVSLVLPHLDTAAARHDLSPIVRTPYPRTPPPVARRSEVSSVVTPPSVPALEIPYMPTGARLASQATTVRKTHVAASSPFPSLTTIGFVRRRNPRRKLTVPIKLRLPRLAAISAPRAATVVGDGNVSPTLPTPTWHPAWRVRNIVRSPGSHQDANFPSPGLPKDLELYGDETYSIDLEKSKSRRKSAKAEQSPAPPANDNDLYLTLLGAYRSRLLGGSFAAFVRRTCSARQLKAIDLILACEQDVRRTDFEPFAAARPLLVTAYHPTRRPNSASDRVEGAGRMCLFDLTSDRLGKRTAYAKSADRVSLLRGLSGERMVEFREGWAKRRIALAVLGVAVIAAGACVAWVVVGPDVRGDVHDVAGMTQSQSQSQSERAGRVVGGVAIALAIMCGGWVMVAMWALLSLAMM
ncbi:hypothetical protein MRB53_038507 [Persea americana]|nr:hypothetical protein MRB53_038507 [Persea americana]